MEYSVNQIVKKVLIVDHLEYLVGDKVKLISTNGGSICGEILKIECEYLKIRTKYFGDIIIYYGLIKNIRLIEN